ncbi:MAG: O-antigen polysaccharide polymerase Wzy family protein [Prevotellaceae bacterium]|jgi:oligosaccharide repeat unit polymerase|nr:O-antigen polysaccharide polymerase Wzy family protein [Prevotellaceae bacterium]
MKIRDIAFIHLGLLLCFTISTILLCFVDKTDFVVTYNQILLFVIYFWVLSAQILLNGLMHLFTIFLGGYFVFLLGQPFFDLIGVIDITKNCLFRYIELSNEIYVTTYTYSTFFLLFTFCGVLFGYKSNNKGKKIKEINYSPYLFSISIIFLFLALPGILTKYYIQIQVILEKGYLAIYDGTLQQINYPLICKGAGTLLIIGYCIFISSKPSKKYFLIITAIFLLTQAVNVLKGQRAVLMFPFVFAIWFYFKFYVKNLSVTKLILIIMGVVVLGQAIQIFRSGEKYIKAVEEKSFTEKYVNSFFVQQGVSFFVFPYTLHYHVENDRYPYILAPLNIKSFNQPQNMERLQQNNFVADQLMYKMDPKGYKIGLGTGSSILAVFYDLPHIIALLSATLFGFLIARFEFFVRQSRGLLLFSYFIVFSVVASPRFELFQLFYDFVMLGIAFIVINMLYLILQTQKRTSIENL